MQYKIKQHNVMSLTAETFFQASKFCQLPTYFWISQPIKSTELAKNI